jgi:hypothetical protein
MPLTRALIFWLTEYPEKSLAANRLALGNKYYQLWLVLRVFI